MPKRISQWSAASFEQPVRRIIAHPGELNDVSNGNFGWWAFRPELRLEPSSWYLLITGLCFQSAWCIDLVIWRGALKALSDWWCQVLLPTTTLRGTRVAMLHTRMISSKSRRQCCTYPLRDPGMTQPGQVSTMARRVTIRTLSLVKCRCLKASEARSLSCCMIAWVSNLKSSGPKAGATLVFQRRCDSNDWVSLNI